jgi:biotin carboxyl carrier protein
MTRRRVIFVVGGIAAAVVITVGFLAGRKELGKERDREAPVAAPSLLRQVSTDAGSEAAIILDDATVQRIGIRTITIGNAASGGGSIKLTGELVSDPARITTIRAAVPGRVTALGGAWPSLGQTLSAGREFAQVSDARPLVVPRTGVVTRISSQPGELVQAGQELVELTDFREPLARVVWRLDLPLSPTPTVTVTPLGGLGAGSLARYVAPAAHVDTVTRAPAFMYRVSATWPGARPGLPIVATIPDPRASASGVFVPTEAVVQWEGLSWAYVQRASSAAAGRAPQHAYVRVRIDTANPIDGGWIVQQAVNGVSAGNTIVVRGAQQLLSEEFRARIEVGNEGG